jgi:hypothetical protein
MQLEKHHAVCYTRVAVTSGVLSILEYMNVAEERWYAVNPVVRELDKFKRQVEDPEGIHRRGAEDTEEERS